MTINSLTVAFADCERQWLSVVDDAGVPWISPLLPMARYIRRLHPDVRFSDYTERQLENERQDALRRAQVAWGDEVESCKVCSGATAYGGSVEPSRAYCNCGRHFDLPLKG